ncbi:hypothetical protein Tco_1378857 [Tanacetum coccineum]
MEALLIAWSITYALLKKEIRVFVADQKKNKEGRVKDIKAKLSDNDNKLDQEVSTMLFLQLAMECSFELKWVWRFLSRDNSLWFRIIHAIHGSQDQGLSAAFPSNWSSIVKEVKALFTQGGGTWLGILLILHFVLILGSRLEDDSSAKEFRRGS